MSKIPKPKYRINDEIVFEKKRLTVMKRDWLGRVKRREWLVTCGEAGIAKSTYHDGEWHYYVSFVSARSNYLWVKESEIQYKL